MNDKIRVVPDDDPSAANAEVEIIASRFQSDGKLYRVLCKITPMAATDTKEGRALISKSMVIAFKKQGYKLWHHMHQPEIILTDDSGSTYAWAVFEKL